MSGALWRACGPVALPLLLLSVAVFTVGFDRLAFWWRWWRRGRRPWRELCGALAAAPSPEVRTQLLENGDEQMAWGEAVLQAAVVLAPLLGLVGTTAGLMGVLKQLGPQLLLPPTAPLAGYGDVLLPTLLGLQLTVVAMALLLLNQGLRRWQLRRCAAMPS
jgi:biopolymer transport protein ExbB